MLSVFSAWKLPVFGVLVSLVVSSKELDVFFRLVVIGARNSSVLTQFCYKQLQLLDMVFSAWKMLVFGVLFRLGGSSKNSSILTQFCYKQL